MMMCGVINLWLSPYNRGMVVVVGRRTYLDDIVGLNLRAPSHLAVVGNPLNTDVSHALCHSQTLINGIIKSCCGTFSPLSSLPAKMPVSPTAAQYAGRFPDMLLPTAFRDAVDAQGIPAARSRYADGVIACCPTESNMRQQMAFNGYQSMNDIPFILLYGDDMADAPHPEREMSLHVGRECTEHEECGFGTNTFCATECFEGECDEIEDNDAPFTIEGKNKGWCQRCNQCEHEPGELDAREVRNQRDDM